MTIKHSISVKTQSFDYCLAIPRDIACDMILKSNTALTGLGEYRGTGALIVIGNAFGAGMIL